MKRLIEYLPFIVLGLGGCIIVAALFEYREKNENETSATELVKPMVATAPNGKNRSPEDRALTHAVFNDPATLDSAEASTNGVIVIHNAGKPPAGLPEETVLGGDSSAMLKDQQAAVDADDLEAFASLRADALRNPDSEQNRMAVESIMRKRNHRVEQLGLD